MADEVQFPKIDIDGVHDAWVERGLAHEVERDGGYGWFCPTCEAESKQTWESRLIAMQFATVHHYEHREAA
ncbi:hypothetical protein J4U01_gp001 [Mycobacterium phage Kumao]|uniref:Uncharacterized protein n=1 Tax=Mycobacterium phage Kumao TaxID=2041344 RepID=A0A2D1GPP2_9CAUD|nr:hypothetical protein J4U01_gp001 [Mycobacterium phage Kumao]ATN93964.1 hypothetical protein SEA_KUMAO_1 [Mycobacterium phage Kumao]